MIILVAQSINRSNLARETIFSLLLKRKHTHILCISAIDIHRKKDQLFVSASFSKLMLQMHRYISKQAKFFTCCWMVEKGNDQTKSDFSLILCFYISVHSNTLFTTFSELRTLQCLIKGDGRLSFFGKYFHLPWILLRSFRLSIFIFLHHKWKHSQHIKLPTESKTVKTIK